MLSTIINGFEYSFEECREALESRGYEICLYNGSRDTGKISRAVVLFAVKKGTKIPNPYFDTWQDVAKREFSKIPKNKPSLI